MGLEQVKAELDEAWKEADGDSDGRLKLSRPIKIEFRAVGVEIEHMRDEVLLRIFKKSLGYTADEENREAITSIRQLELRIYALADRITAKGFLVP